MYTLFVRRKMRLTGRLVQAAPHLTTCVLHTWDDFTQTTWVSTQSHFVPVKTLPLTPPSSFASFTSFSGMVSICLQTVWNYSPVRKSKYHLCLHIWGQCVTVNRRVFSALIWWSYRDRSPSTLLSTAGMAVRSGLVPGSKWTIKSQGLTMFRGNEGKVCQHTLTSSFHHWKDDVMLKPHILRRPVI